ncbi:TPA: hypothetical protein U0V61_004771 [Escherichia coli]|nr:hypothetical protein [Escherichia marmotae]MED8847203.1 hypothetical protein [Escherichia coli]MED9634511.1 hypothetical protein [Escherichia marmotae]HAY0228576.1 hypothetical protein [Escherichia coli]HEL8020309.1 hypothetical protein [Escherichia coli]
MLGFVAALSSSVSAMILLMTVLLINLLSSIIDKDNKINSSVIISPNVTSNANKVIAHNSGGFSTEDLVPLKQGELPLNVYCEYGNNYNEYIARNMTTYNYLKATGVLKGRKIHISKPKFSPDTKNTCYIEEEVQNGQ